MKSGKEKKVHNTHTKIKTSCIKARMMKLYRISLCRNICKAAELTSVSHDYYWQVSYLKTQQETYGTLFVTSFQKCLKTEIKGKSQNTKGNFTTQDAVYTCSGGGHFLESCLSHVSVSWGSDGALSICAPLSLISESLAYSFAWEKCATSVC